MQVPSLSPLPRLDPDAGLNPFRWIVEAAAQARAERSAGAHCAEMIRRVARKPRQGEGAPG